MYCSLPYTCPRLDLPSPPSTDPLARKGTLEVILCAYTMYCHPGSGLKGIAEALSVTTSRDSPLSYPDFKRQMELNKQMEELKQQCREVPKSSTSDRDTST